MFRLFSSGAAALRWIAHISLYGPVLPGGREGSSNCMSSHEIMLSHDILRSMFRLFSSGAAALRWIAHISLYGPVLHSATTAGHQQSRSRPGFADALATEIPLGNGGRPLPPTRCSWPPDSETVAPKLLLFPGDSAPKYSDDLLAFSIGGRR